MKSLVSQIPLGIAAVLLLQVTSTGSSCYQDAGKSHELRNMQLTPAIEMRGDEAGLGDLREAAVKNGDMEIRIWREPTISVDVAEGYVLQRLSGSWSGKHLTLNEKKQIVVVGQGNLVSITPPKKKEGVVVEIEPLNGWDFLWTSLEGAGLLTLPDESSLDLRATGPMKDGFIYVVEIKTRDTYRAYRYTTPENYETPETRSMVRIVRIINEEFSEDQQQ